MARAQETYGKKEREKKRLKKREEKKKKKAERQANSNTGATFEEQLVYVDENGHFTDTPTDPTKKVKIDAESIVLGIPKKEDQELFNTCLQPPSFEQPAGAAVPVVLAIT